MNILTTRLMTTIKEIRKKVDDLKKRLLGQGIHQYTIDIVENLYEELIPQECGEGTVTNSVFFSAKSYEICNLLEIIDRETEDRIFLEKLLEIIEEGRKL